MGRFGSLDPQSIRQARWGRACKRSFDLMIAVPALLFLLPVLLIAAACVRISTPGAIIFSQQRIGRGGREFQLYKFRTMVVDQHGLIDTRRLEADALAGILTKLEHDPRVTKVGRLLRRTSIDELPQLVNVVAGHMSLVGPRPLPAFMLEPYRELSQARMLVRPGLTGLWQISDRKSNTTAEAMAPFDLRYIEEFSLLLDLKILVSTVPACVRGSGAY